MERITVNLLNKNKIVRKSDIEIKRKKVISSGEPIPDKSVPIFSLRKAVDRVRIEGKIVDFSYKVNYKNKKYDNKLLISDKTGTMECVFTTILRYKIDIGEYVMVCGSLETRHSSAAGDLYLKIQDMEKIEFPDRIDYQETKRVDFHVHSKYSAMDGIMDIVEYVKTGKEMGHKALCLTDHGVVYSFPKFYKLCKDNGIEPIFGCEIYMADSWDEDAIKNKIKVKSHHAVVIVRDQEGFEKLYQLISDSYVKYFYYKNYILKEELAKYKEHFLIGTACSAGELQEYLIKSDLIRLPGIPETHIPAIREIVEFYDYIEIMPHSNNSFMLSEGYSIEDLKNLNKLLYDISKITGIPAVATTDSHYLNPEDQLLFKVLKTSMKFTGVEDPYKNFYYRTTDELLDEFDYFGDEVAREIVIQNTNYVFSLIDKDLYPVKKGFYPPVIDKAEEKIKELTIKKLSDKYGNDFPTVIKERYDEEMKLLLEKNFSSIYLIAAELVQESKRLGWPSGSRGSVGSSFIAYLMDITEVNPLPYHYYCSECKKILFVKNQGSYYAGADLPPRKCECGADMVGDGYNLDFNSFVGWEGSKVPDIDLNFSSYIQLEIMKYLENKFGTENTIRAGTIGTLKDQTTYGYAVNYKNAVGLDVNDYELRRWSKQLCGVMRTNGQHPGGLLVIPEGQNINSFTPVQKLKNSEFLTTHFEYHDIEENLAKLDILAQDSTTMVKKMSDMTGMDYEKIPLNDIKVFNMMLDIRNIGIDGNDFFERTGLCGIPEFGTPFTRQMVSQITNNEKISFGLLTNICGLAHGTDVWNNNAEPLVNISKKKLNELVCTREQIYQKLIEKGIEGKEAYQIMETIRKGKQLKKEQIQLMKGCDLDEWFFNFCNKISYLFPAAHAIAYTLQSVRVAYFKYYFPLEFYKVYFENNIDKLSQKLLMNVDQMKNYLENTNYFDYSLTKKEKDEYLLMEVALEMKLRGINFSSFSLKNSMGGEILYDKEKSFLIPPLILMDGIGPAIAMKIDEFKKELAKEGRDISDVDIMEIKKVTGMNKNHLNIFERNTGEIITVKRDKEWRWNSGNIL